MYKQWKTDNISKAKINLVTFLLSPITYSIVLYHGQIDVILITFLYLTILAFGDHGSSEMRLKWKDLSHFATTTTLYAISIASKTWSIIMFPIFAIPILKNFSIKRVFWFLSFVLVVVGLLFVNIKLYTLSVFGSSTQVVLSALTHPGGPTGVWGLGLVFRFFRKEESYLIFRLPVLGLGVYWSYIYYQIIFVKKKFSNLFLILMTILTFYIFAPRWGVQYIFWHWPFLLLTDNGLIKHWIYQLLIPAYLLVNYFNITANEMIFPSWITWGLGFAIYLVWLKWGLIFLNKSKAKLVD